MRILFWFLIALSLIGFLLVFGLLSERQSGEVGMAFILFLPACMGSIALGAAAVLLRVSKPCALTLLERRVGLVYGVLLVLGVCVLMVALLLD